MAKFDLMWTIGRPAFSVSDVFDVCIERLQGADHKSRMRGIATMIHAAEADFDTRSTAGQGHLIVQTGNLSGANGVVAAKEMTQLYDRHVARATSKGRASYDKIMASAVHGQCPFCGHLPVSTLDHTLPKKHFSVLAVTPLNLVPSCKDCNFNKGTSTSTNPARQFLNPYYDDVTDTRWLFAEIVEGAPAAVKYWTAPPIAMDALMAQRIRYHFDELKLAKIYASQGARQLQNMKSSLKKTFQAAGANVVQSDLLERTESCQNVTLNSWEGALYEAAAQSEWYINGGFAAR
jgi:hypothetical protein